MIIFNNRQHLGAYLGKRRNKASIGFVPTMGALHQGHLQLVDRCRIENEFTVTSIFVNPTQFNDPQDFQKYPRTLEKDILMLEQRGCDILYVPTVEDIYPEGTAGGPHYDLGTLEQVFEGRYRPGHFQGVCRVVDRLLANVQPHRLYLGQKDYQQCMVIRRMISLTGHEASLVICETIREENGLAMSSRNMRLSPEQKEDASAIYRSLRMTKSQLVPGPLTSLQQAALRMLADAGLKPDYFAFADALDLEPLENWDGERQVVALVAAFMGEVRLIDNLILNN